MASRRELSRVIEGSIDSDLSLSFDEGEKVGRRFNEFLPREERIIIIIVGFAWIIRFFPPEIERGKPERNANNVNPKP